LILFFTHIPKTAGSSFAKVYLQPNFQSGYKRPEGLSDFFYSRLPKYTCVHGHFPYGMHHLKPWRRINYITFLREPVNRIISHYFFVLQMKTHPEFLRHKTVGIKEITSVNYSLKYSALQSNQQTRFIAGFYHGFWNPPSDAKLLKIAKQNLIDKYSFIGILERYQESCERFEKIYNLNSYKDEKKYQKTIIKKDISQKDKIDIENNNQLDLELYSYFIKKKFS